MKIIVVGGGITGCAISSFLADQNCEIDLYESSNKLGGVLTDIYFNNNYYYNDCQYINKEAYWLNELREKTDIEIFEFLHSYGSFTCINNEQTISKNFAGPVIPYYLSDQEVKEMVAKSEVLTTECDLEKRLLCYPRKVTKFLIEWVKKQTTIDIKNLSDLSAISLQISRIYLKNEEQKILKLKTEYKSLDKLLGLPRNYFYQDKLKAVLPLKGFDDLFNKFYVLLENKKVNINRSSFIKVKKDKNNNGFIFFDKYGKELNYDLIIWAASPFHLIKKLINKPLNNHLDLCFTYIFQLKSVSKNEFTIPFYVQIFSLYHPFRRLYIYCKNNDEIIVSIESLQKVDIENILPLIYDILEEFEYFGRLEYIGTKKHHKKILLNQEEMILLQKLKETFSGNNIIDGGWHLYSRENRIEYVKNQVISLL